MSDEKAVFTRGPIESTMLKAGLSMLPGTLAMSGYNIVDTYFVGQLGKIPLAAMGFTFPVVMLLSFIFGGFGTGVMAPTAQALGAKNRSEAERLVTTGLYLFLAMSAFFAVVGMLTGNALFGALGAKGEVFDQVIGYMDIWYFGIVTMGITMLGNNLLICIGRTKSASFVMCMGLIFNALLDPILINGWWGFPEMGIRGAAVATIIGQSISMIGSMTMLIHRDKLIRFFHITWACIKSALKRIISFALPACIGLLMVPTGMFVVTWITARFGDAAMAATTATSRLEMVAFVFPMALGMSLMPMVAQNFGAKLYKRLKVLHRFSATFAFVFLTLAAVVYYIYAQPLSQIFYKGDDPEVIDIMVSYMRIIPWGFGFVEIHRFSTFIYNGCNKPAFSSFLSGLRVLGFLIPFSFIALYFDSIEGLFVARLMADICSGTIGFTLSGFLVAKLIKSGEEPVA